VYGGKGDEDINIHNEHTATKLKMVSMYDLMLDPFKGVGHCVVMDSAYMGDAMCQVGRAGWGINMVGTVQSSRTGGGRLGKAAIKVKEIEKGTHESLLYQHNTKPLLHAVWADNNFVKTLSKFHSPAIVEGGMKRRIRDPVTKKGQENKVMLIVLYNRLTTARPTIRLIMGMVLKLSMICRPNLICMVGLQS
jgi:hypothetical protein